MSLRVYLLLQSGRWDDVACTELNTYICKAPRAHYPLPSVEPTVYGCPQVEERLFSPRVHRTLILISVVKGLTYDCLEQHLESFYELESSNVAHVHLFHFIRVRISASVTFSFL